jgi:hypothetical protein
VLVVLVSIFVFYPVASMFIGAFQSFDGSFSPDGFLTNIQDPPSGAWVAWPAAIAAALPGARFSWPS